MTSRELRAWNAKRVAEGKPALSKAQVVSEIDAGARRFLAEQGQPYPARGKPFRKVRFG